MTEDESRQGRVVPLCLAEIRDSNCVIILLGESYGSRCRLDTVPPDCRDEHPWLEACAGRSYTEIEIEAALFQRPAATGAVICYSRDPGYSERAGFREAGEGGTLLADLKRRIRASGVTWRDYRDPDEFATQALADLTLQLAATDPGDDCPHAAYARVRAGLCVGRDNWLARLDRNRAGGGPPLAIRAATGLGKTTVLAAWLARPAAEPPRPWWSRWLGGPPRPELCFQHFVGADEASGAWPHLLRRLFAALRAGAGIPWPVPEHPAALAEALPAWLGRAARTQRVLLVLDGLDRLAAADEGAGLAWLPLAWPRGVHLVATVSPGPVADELARRGWRVADLEPWPPAARTTFIAQSLAVYGKRLAPETVAAVAAAPLAGCPLYLGTVVEELRVLGGRRLLADRLAACAAVAELPQLFDLVADRWGQDLDSDRPGLVGDSLALVAASRHGLSEAELLDLLGGAAPLPPRWWAEARAVLGRGLWDFQGVLRFAHPALRAAVERRAFAAPDGARAWQRRLADYFGRDPGTPRAVAELPWLLTRLAAWDELAAVLCAPSFLRAGWPRYASEVAAYWGLVAQSRPGAVAELAERLARVPDAPWPAAGVLLELGFPHLALGVAERWPTADGDPDAATVWGFVADCRNRLRDAAGATAALAEQTRCLPTGDRRTAGNRLARAALCRRAGDPDGAARLIAEAAAAAVGDDWLAAECHAAQALVDLDRQRWRSALRLLRPEERTRRLLGDLPGLQRCLGHVGVAFRQRGAWSAALQAHAEEESICQRLADRDGLQRCLSNQAAIRMDQAKYDAAFALVERRVGVGRDLGEPAALADALRQRAFLVGKKLGQPHLALADLREAARLAAACGLPGDAIAALLRDFETR